MDDLPNREKNQYWTVYWQETGALYKTFWLICRGVNKLGGKIRVGMRT